MAERVGDMAKAIGLTYKLTIGINAHDFSFKPA